jgi:hypothetical protein
LRRTHAVRKALPICIVLVLSGCNRDFFQAHGMLASRGSRIGSWSSTPEGCTRDPFDGLPPDQTTSIVTLLWEDPGIRNPLVNNRTSAPDAPSRLGFSRSPVGVTARLETLRDAGIPLDSNVCRTLRLETEEHASRVPGGRPSLSGRMVLDCQAHGSQIVGDIQFENCHY